MNTAGSSEQSEQNLEQVRRFHASHKIITILTQSKANIEYFIDHLPDIFAIIDANGYICRGNYKLAEIFATHIEKLLGSKFSSLFSEISWKTFKIKLDEVYKNKKSIDFELPCESVNASQLIINWRINEFFSHRKSKRMFCVMGTDITVLRQRKKELENLTENLQELVQKKTRNITVLLDSIQQGIFSIDKDMNMTEAHSRFAEKIFGTERFHNRSVSDLLELSDDEAKDLHQWLKLLEDPKKLKRWQKFLPLNPVKKRVFKLNNEKRTVKIDYQPITENGKLNQMMFLCTDVTEKIKAENALKQAEKKNDLKMQRVLGFVNNMQVSLKMFLDETNQYLDKFKSAVDPASLLNLSEEIYRSAHTIKGNAGTFGFHELSRHAGVIEEIISDIFKNQECSPVQFVKWKNQLVDINGEFDQITAIREKMFQQSESRIGILAAEYHKLVKDITEKKTTDVNEICQRLTDLSRQPFSEYCQKYNNIINMYRTRYQKNIHDLVIETPESPVHKETIAAMDTPLLHIIRNAIDHGIESNDQRENAGKGAGRISISYASDSSEETVIITDDGRGIDPELISGRAVTLGLVSRSETEKMNNDEKIQLIMKTGFTTKKKVTSVSGRGAGLAAAMAHMEALGGTLELQTEKGRGTTFKLSLPKMSL